MFVTDFRPSGLHQLARSGPRQPARRVPARTAAGPPLSEQQASEWSSSDAERLSQGSRTQRRAWAYQPPNEEPEQPAESKEVSGTVCRSCYSFHSFRAACCLESLHRCIRKHLNVYATSSGLLTLYLHGRHTLPRLPLCHQPWGTSEGAGTRGATILIHCRHSNAGGHTLSRLNRSLCSSSWCLPWQSLRWRQASRACVESFSLLQRPASCYPCRRVSSCCAAIGQSCSRTPCLGSSGHGAIVLKPVHHSRVCSNALPRRPVHQREEQPRHGLHHHALTCSSHFIARWVVLSRCSRIARSLEHSPARQAELRAQACHELSREAQALFKVARDRALRAPHGCRVRNRAPHQALEHGHMGQKTGKA